MSLGRDASDSPSGTTWDGIALSWETNWPTSFWITLLSGLVYGVSYACLYSAFDRGRVTIVAPLVATESLWAVLISILVLRRSERIGARLLVAAAFVVGGGALISSFR